MKLLGLLIAAVAARTRRERVAAAYHRPGSRLAYAVLASASRAEVSAQLLLLDAAASARARMWGAA